MKAGLQRIGGVISPGDLFINILNNGSDTTWDCVFDLLDEPPGHDNTDPGEGNYGFYSVSVWQAWP